MWRMHLRTHLVQLLRTAQRCVHIVRVVEQRVVHFVFTGVLAERDHMLEPMAPQDLGGQVAASRLCRHSR